MTDSQLNQFLAESGDVTTTLYDFGDAEIRRSVQKGLCLLEISGFYSAPLARELEKLALQWKGDLGLAFHDIKVHPQLRRRFDNSVVGVLRKILRRVQSRKKTLSLCSPPSELVDKLKLAGTLNQYQILDGSSPAAEPTPAPFGPGSGLRRSTDDATPQRKQAARPENGHGDGVAPQQKRIQFLNQSLRRTEKLERGLDAAARYVLQFLPQSPPELPGYEFAFWYQSSEKVGGDFFDFLPLCNGRIGVCIGDVSGHGMDAALLMGISKKVIRIRALDDTTLAPADVLGRASKDVSEDFRASSFVTALYGILEPETGKFTFARAGHEHPILLGPGPGMFATITTQGVPLGLDKFFDMRRALSQQAAHLMPGAYLLLFTDGLPEAQSVKGIQYGRERLAYDMREVPPDASCQQILAHLQRAFESFTGGAPQEDDITVIVIKRLL